MRLVRFRARTGSPRIGVLVDDRVFELERGGDGDMRALVAAGHDEIVRLAEAARGGTGLPVDDVQLLAPIANPGKLLAVAGGFYTGDAEPRLGPDAKPLVFCKRTDDIAGPGDPITIWGIGPDVIDEIEVAIVIGRGGRNIARERALDHVF